MIQPNLYNILVHLKPTQPNPNCTEWVGLIEFSGHRNLNTLVNISSELIDSCMLMLAAKGESEKKEMDDFDGKQWRIR